MCFTLKSARVNCLSTVVIILLLSGCGTIARSYNKESTPYLGTISNIEATADPYLPQFTYGIGPFIVLATLPIDIAIDTVRLPIDATILYRRIKKSTAYKNRVYQLSVIGINLINPKMQISYTVKYPSVKYSDVSTTFTAEASSTIGPLNKYSQTNPDLYLDRNAANINSLLIEWRLSEPYKYNHYDREESEKLKPKYAYSISEEVSISDIDTFNSALVVIFMPCYQTMIIPIDYSQSAEELIETPEIQLRYQELLQQDNENSCILPPSFSQVPF